MVEMEVAVKVEAAVEALRDVAEALEDKVEFEALLKVGAPLKTRAQTQMVMEMQWSHHQAVRTEKPSCTSSDECNCVVCDTHNNGRWIQCDICDSWCHFKCANIPDNLAAESSAESLDWQCPKCN